MKICSIENCKKKHHGNGLCQAHWKLNMRQSNPAYSVWQDIKRRCYNRNYKQYKDWGGRGIIVCDRWINSYSNFLKDMGERPSPEHSIERINTNGNYEPGNCRWATKFEQNNNRRDTVKITIDNLTDTFSGWATRTGLSRSLIVTRYYKGVLGSDLIKPSRYKTGRYVHG